MEQSVSKKRFYNLISNIVNYNKISHAYLIEIDDYEKDFVCILDFVKLILKKNNTDDDIDNLVDTGNYLDLKIIEPDGNVIKKKQLLQLQEDFRNKSFLNNKMIYIIKEVEKLNDSSANTILKFLEEPEEDIVAILVANNRYNVIDTILSRCQVLSLQENDSMANVSENCIEMMKFIIKKDDLFINYQYIFDNIMPDKVVAKSILSDIEHLFIDYLNYVSNVDDFVVSSDISKILSTVDTNKITEYISIIEDELKKLEFNVNYKLWLDCLFARFIGG